MEIFVINQDLDRYQYLLQKTEQDFIDVLDREGQEIKDWKEPTWVIYKDKKNKTKGSDFSASAYFSGKLLMQENLAKKMLMDFNLSAQLLPINTPELSEKFVFVNILGGVSAILESFWYDEEDLWNAKHMPKALTRKVFPELDGKYAFDSAVLEQNPIFRDKWFCGFYFCTDVFVEWAEKNGVKGLSYENAGIIR